MADKVQLIRQEIERLKTQNETYLDKEYAESTKWHKHGAYDICFQLLNFIDSLPEEPTKEELEEEIDRYYSDWQFDDDTIYEDMRDICRHFAEWQKKKDQETIELAEDHAMLAGMNKMKEEMMKDAVIAWVNTYESVTNPYDNEVSFITNLSPSKFKNKETVKIIIIKEEQ